MWEIELCQARVEAFLALGGDGKIKGDGCVPLPPRYYML